MANVRFYTEKRKDKKTGETREKNIPIFLSFTFQGNRLILYTQERINEKDWDQVKQRVKSNARGATQINAYLESLGDEIKGLYRDMRTRKETPTVQYLRENVSIKKNTSKKGFFDIIDEFIAKHKKPWSIGTTIKFETLKKLLQNFEEAKKYKIEFDSLNEQFFDRFTDYLIQDRNHFDSYISKNIKNLKWFLNWAKKKGYNKNSYYSDYTFLKNKSKASKNNVVSLSWSELMKLYKLKLDSVALEHVKDVFLFSCFSGLRYSDVRNLKKSDIKENDFIIINTIKTSAKLGIPLNDFSKALLKKYKKFPGEKAFPVISNQKMNKHLKTIGKKAEFNDKITIVKYQGGKRIENTSSKWELLCTHTGRRTFVSIAIELKISTEVIMAITGHKDHKMLEKYYSITNPHKTEEMAKFSESYMKIAK